MKQTLLTSVDVSFKLLLRSRRSYQSQIFAAIYKAQVMQENTDFSIEYFECSFMLCDKWKVKPQDVYNMDEQGCSTGLYQKTQVVLPLLGAEAVAITTTYGNREWATLIDTIRTTGADIPTF